MICTMNSFTPSVARYHTIPHICYKCFKIGQVGHTGCGIMYPPSGHDYGWQAFGPPREGIEGEHVRNLIEAKVHDAE